MSGDTEYDFQFEDDEFGLEDPVTGAEPKKIGEEVDVEIEQAQWSGEKCAELYAYGEAFNDEMEKVKKKVLLARVTETELTMFPLVSAYHRYLLLTEILKKVPRHLAYRADRQSAN